MSMELERQAVTSYIQTNWNATYGVLFFEDQDFDQPAGQFVLVSLIPVGQSQVSFSGDTNLFRNIGILQFDILVPEGTGSRSARLAGDFIIGLMRNKNFRLSDQNVVQIRTPDTLRKVAAQNGRVRWVISFEYYRDELGNNPVPQTTTVP